MSMISDVGANFGVLISSNGFTSSVPRRVREFGDRIKLEHLDWQEACSDSCGWVIVAEHEEPCCELRDVLYAHVAKET